MSRRWWLCGRYQLFAKSIRHAQTYNQTQMNTSQVGRARWGALGTVFVILCKRGKFLLVMGGCSTYSAAALLEDITQEMLLVVDKLRDQDEALMQKVSLVTDLVGKCICMEQQVKDKKKGFNMEWATSEW
ncbi:hypothetical protein MUCCIDRAFT_159263 [Mucor lusitanicus CBS 277.49]|uniref:Uncharacterized protein n=1 Tax=Mucor lusitanicus CBS 277.49 TaxID=747725 RepID=A0A168QDY3_MUCCL|nr:hypothetical protein MUCCIDRAFT_159263 [Mucor lusitanicus CBS 277.49]